MSTTVASSGLHRLCGSLTVLIVGTARNRDAAGQVGDQLLIVTDAIRIESAATAEATRDAGASTFWEARD